MIPVMSYQALNIGTFSSYHFLYRGKTQKMNQGNPDLVGIVGQTSRDGFGLSRLQLRKRFQRLLRREGCLPH